VQMHLVAEALPALCNFFSIGNRGISFAVEVDKDRDAGDCGESALQRRRSESGRQHHRGADRTRLSRRQEATSFGGSGSEIIFRSGTALCPV